MALAITGIGMVSSLGTDAVTSCAAARAGLVRPSDVESFVLEEGEAGIVLASVHRAVGIDRGFQGAARLAQLFRWAYEDSMRERSAEWDSDREALYIVVPDDGRNTSALGQIADTDEREEIEAWTKDLPTPRCATAVAEELMGMASRIGRWPKTPRVAFATTVGRTGFALALERARKDLESGLVDRAMVGAVDSLVDPWTLEWLHQRRRLKGPDSPTGTSPGEAGVFLRLEIDIQAQRRGAMVQGCIGPVAWSHEASPYIAAKPPTGRALSDVWLSTRSSDRRSTEEASQWVVSPQNGEEYFAMEHGLAEVILSGQSLETREADVWYPIASFGDVGGAFGPLAACGVVRAFARGYAPCNSAMILLSDDGPERAAILIETACKEGVDGKTS